MSRNRGLPLQPYHRNERVAGSVQELVLKVKREHLIQQVDEIHETNAPQKPHEIVHGLDCAFEVELLFINLTRNVQQIVLLRKDTRFLAPERSPVHVGLPALEQGFKLAILLFRIERVLLVGFGFEMLIFAEVCGLKEIVVGLRIPFLLNQVLLDFLLEITFRRLVATVFVLLSRVFSFLRRLVEPGFGGVQSLRNLADSGVRLLRKKLLPVEEVAQEFSEDHLAHSEHAKRHHEEHCHWNDIRKADAVVLVVCHFHRKVDVEGDDAQRRADRDNEESGGDFIEPSFKACLHWFDAIDAVDQTQVLELVPQNEVIQAEGQCPVEVADDVLGRVHVSSLVFEVDVFQTATKKILEN